MSESNKVKVIAVQDTSAVAVDFVDPETRLERDFETDDGLWFAEKFGQKHSGFESALEAFRTFNGGANND